MPDCSGTRPDCTLQSRKASVALRQSGNKGWSESPDFKPSPEIVSLASRLAMRNAWAEDLRPTDQLAAGAALPDWVVLPDCPTGKCSPNARLHIARLVARRYQEASHGFRPKL